MLRGSLHPARQHQRIRYLKANTGSPSERHMPFESNKDVLEWYERQPRTLTPEFVSSIPWHEVKDHPVDQRLIPVLLYMRDVETLTDMYHREMLRTPTGRDPYISKFMERWGLEEMDHAHLLNRFLSEAGVDTDDKWQAKVRGEVPAAYNASAYLATTLANLIGSKFTASHMTFGAIHEMSTTQGYRQVIKLARHPVLTQLLSAIIREESAHTQFYWSIARLELKKNEFARRIARFVVEHFWKPVGQGSLPKKRTEYLISTLFGNDDGLALLDTTLTQRLRRLPGFDDVTKINETLERICRNAFAPALAGRALAD